MKPLFTLLCFVVGLTQSYSVSAQRLLSPKFLFRYNPEERALILHQKGVIAWKKGDIKKAEKYFSLADRTARERSRELEMYEFYVAAGKPRTALMHLERTQCGDACNGIDRVREAASFAMISSNLGEREKAVHYANVALKEYKTYHLKDSVLYSTLLNNYAIFLLFDQGLNGENKEEYRKISIRQLNAVLPIQLNRKTPEGHYKFIAKSDFLNADSCIRKAMAAYPGNCMAEYNHSILKEILSLKPSANGYIPDSLLLSFTTSDIPEECTSKDTINKFASLEETFVECSDLLLIMDYSGSMYSGNRFGLMMETVHHLIDTLPEAIRIGVLSVEGSCSQAPMLQIPPGSMTRNQLKEALSGKSPGGATPLNVRLEMAPKMFLKGGKRRMAMLLTDGLDACEGPARTCDMATQLKEYNIEVYVLTQLLEADENYLSLGVYSCLAANSNGKLLYLEEKSRARKKSVELNSALYNLPLRVKDLATGTITPFKPQPFVPVPLATNTTAYSK